MLAADTGLDVVRAGEAHTRRLGVSGVSFFVVNARVARAGAPSPELILPAFELTSRFHRRLPVGRALAVRPRTRNRDRNRHGTRIEVGYTAIFACLPGQLLVLRGNEGQGIMS